MRAFILLTCLWRFEFGVLGAEIAEILRGTEK